MPQIDTKPAPAKKLIDAGMPPNISAADKAKLEADWNRQAAERAAAIAKETKIPDIPGLTLRYQLRKFGHHWNAYVPDKNGKYFALLPAPSLLISAIDALTDRMTSDAQRL